MVEKHVFFLPYVRNITSFWKACTLADLANLRKTKCECSHITRVLTHITKKWDKQKIQNIPF